MENIFEQQRIRQEEIKEWEEESNELCKNMNDWQKEYKHKNPCERYLKYKFCDHLVKARTQKFRDRINKSLGKLFELNNQRIRF